MSTGVVNLGTAPRLLLSAYISNLFGMNYKQLEAVADKVYDKKDSKQNFEESVLMNGIGVAQVKNEGGTIALDSYGQGPGRRTYHQVYAKAMKVTMEHFNDNMHMNVASVASKELAKSLFHAKEILGASYFNNATSTSAPFVGLDGKALIASDHPTGVGTTYSNLASTDFSELALENAIITIRNWIGYDGLKINVKTSGLKLLIPNNTIFDAHRILKSELRSGTADNDANAVKNMGVISEIIPWSFLTDTDCWFLLTNVPGLVHYNRESPQTHHYMEDTTLDSVYQIYERYSFDYFDPHAVFGSMGA